MTRCPTCGGRFAGSLAGGLCSPCAELEFVAGRVGLAGPWRAGMLAARQISSQTHPPLPGRVRSAAVAALLICYPITAGPLGRRLQDLGKLGEPV